MAPEQILGHPISLKSDVFALGTILWELLSEAPPYADVKDSLDALRKAISEIGLPVLKAENLVDLPAEMAADIQHIVGLLQIRPAATRPTAAKAEQLLSAFNASFNGASLADEDDGALDPAQDQDYRAIMADMDDLVTMGTKLTAFYKKHNPQRLTLETLEALMSKFGGREDKLNAELKTKYKFDLDGNPAPKNAKEGSGPKPAAKTPQTLAAVSKPGAPSAGANGSKAVTAQASKSKATVQADMKKQGTPEKPKAPNGSEASPSPVSGLNHVLAVNANKNLATPPPRSPMRSQTYSPEAARRLELTQTSATRAVLEDDVPLLAELGLKAGSEMPVMAALVNGKSAVLSAQTESPPQPQQQDLNDEALLERQRKEEEDRRRKAEDQLQQNVEEERKRTAEEDHQRKEQLLQLQKQGQQQPPSAPPTPESHTLNPFAHGAVGARQAMGLIRQGARLGQALPESAGVVGAEMTTPGAAEYYKRAAQMRARLAALHASSPGENQDTRRGAQYGEGPRARAFEPEVARAVPRPALQGLVGSVPSEGGESLLETATRKAKEWRQEAAMVIREAEQTRELRNEMEAENAPNDREISNDNMSRPRIEMPVAMGAGRSLVPSSNPTADRGKQRQMPHRSGAVSTNSMAHYAQYEVRGTSTSVGARHDTARGVKHGGSGMASTGMTKPAAQAQHSAGRVKSQVEMPGRQGMTHARPGQTRMAPNKQQPGNDNMANTIGASASAMAARGMSPAEMSAAAMAARGMSPAEISAAAMAARGMSPAQYGQYQHSPRNARDRGVLTTPYPQPYARVGTPSLMGQVPATFIQAGAGPQWAAGY